MGTNTVNCCKRNITKLHKPCNKKKTEFQKNVISHLICPSKIKEEEKVNIMLLGTKITIVV